MNAILESPVLEALAFNYLSFNIVWTWVAVVTAAVSFWKIKASSSMVVTTSSSSSPSSSQVERLIMSKESTSSTPASTTMSVDTACSFVKEEGTKVKLTVYFTQDDDGQYCNGDDDEEGEDDEGVELSKEWFENWEKLLKLRKGEMGWYCYQDMKVIDGSVVRLWDGRREAERTAF